MINIINRKILGSVIRPRLLILRSNSNVYVKLINDSENNTLVDFSSLLLYNNLLYNPLYNDYKYLIKFSSSDISFIVGKIFGKLIKFNNINRIIFDRNNYLYHGKITYLIEGIKLSNIIF